MLEVVATAQSANVLITDLASESRSISSSRLTTSERGYQDRDHLVTQTYKYYRYLLSPIAGAQKRAQLACPRLQLNGIDRALGQAFAFIVTFMYRRIVPQGWKLAGLFFVLLI